MLVGHVQISIVDGFEILRSFNLEGILINNYNTIFVKDYRYGS